MLLLFKIEDKGVALPNERAGEFFIGVLHESFSFFSNAATELEIPSNISK